MDFDALLSKADKNTKKVSKTLNELSSEVSNEKKVKMQQLEAQKRYKEELIRRKKMAEAAEAKAVKFTIPKKAVDKTMESELNRQRIESFLAKEKEEELQKKKEKQAEKERLIRLRLSAHGGKANKKIGKHFGMNAIDLQVKYGTDHEHVEKLQKMKWREEEEHDKLSSHYRDGVYKALQQKKKIEEKLRKTDGPVVPHRVATSKANSLAGLSSRHAHSRDNFSPPPEPQKRNESRQPNNGSKPAPKRPAEKLDFDSLMKTAEAISQGKEPPRLSSSYDSGPPAKREMREDRRELPTIKKNVSSAPTSSSMGSSKSSSVNRSSQQHTSSHRMDRSEQSSSKNLASGSKSSNPTASTNSQKSSTSEGGDNKKNARGRFVKGPTPPPLIPPAVPGKRYLPGDIRYNAAANSTSTSAQQAPVTKQPPAPSNRDRPQLGSNGRRIENARPTDNHKNGYGSARENHKNGISNKEDYKSQKSSSNQNDRRRIEDDNRKKILNMERERERDRPRVEQRQQSSSSNMRRDDTSHIDKRKDQGSRSSYSQSHSKSNDRDYHRRPSDNRYGSSSHSRNDRYPNPKDKYRDYSDSEMEDEDDYDSEMDDFIDDSVDDLGELSRQEFEETLKMVNPKYNKKKWQERERSINERDMVTNYRTISKEEARSTRLGLMEDWKEAASGKSRQL